MCTTRRAPTNKMDVVPVVTTRASARVAPPHDAPRARRVERFRRHERRRTRRVRRDAAPASPRGWVLSRAILASRALPVPAKHFPRDGGRRGALPGRTVAVIARDYGGDFTQMIHLASRKAVPVSFIHVPRTGGDTLRFTRPRARRARGGRGRCSACTRRAARSSHPHSRPARARRVAVLPLLLQPARCRVDEPPVGLPAATLTSPSRRWPPARRVAPTLQRLAPRGRLLEVSTSVNMQARYLTCGARDETLDKELITGAERWGVPDPRGARRLVPITALPWGERRARGPPWKSFAGASTACRWSGCPRR